LIPVLAALIVAAAIVAAAYLVTAELRAAREQASRDRALTILHAFAPGIEAARADPRALLVWQPLARTARKLFPAECSALDAAAGGSFPFSRDQLQAAHARWTTEWLAWERAHDAEYKDRAAVAEHEFAASRTPAARARVDAIEREKLDRYQQRYQEYVQVAKALQALIEHAGSA